MQKSEVRILEMLIRVRQWILSRVAAFPAGSRGHELQQSIDTCIRNMESHSTSQYGHTQAAREKTAQKHAADEALREVVEAISRTARSMSRDMPGMEERFRLPPGKDGQTWLSTARDFAAAAAPSAEEFVRRSMPPDFIDDLKARILAVEKAKKDQAEEWDGRVASTANVREAAEQGLEDVRELDAIVRNVYADNEAELAAWESASHVERAPRRAEEDEPTAPPTPASS